MQSAFPTGRLFIGVVAVILSSSLWPRIVAFLEGAREEAFVAPTYAVHDPDANVYRMHTRVWVYEPEPDSKIRRLFVRQLQGQLDVEEGTPEAELFERRVRRFLVDNERGQEVTVHHGEAQAELGKTRPNGHVQGVVEFPATDAPATHLELKYVVEEGEIVLERKVPVLEKRGLSVVSDIDDTIKDSRVLDKKKLLEKTFMKKFQPVAGMADAYRRLDENGASFHYLSSSPWQLYWSLDSFRRRAGFPDGTYHLRVYRPKSIGSNLDLVGDSQPHKLGNLRRLLDTLGQREFIFVGDAGEKDPEIYGTIAREYPDRVRGIYIRKVEGADLSEERFAKAFEGVDGVPTTVFEDPSKIGPASR